MTTAKKAFETVDTVASILKEVTAMRAELASLRARVADLEQERDFSPVITASALSDIARIARNKSYDIR